jgi:hypothetical protein
MISDCASFLRETLEEDDARAATALMASSTDNNTPYITRDSLRVKAIKATIAMANMNASLLSGCQQ